MESNGRLCLIPVRWVHLISVIASVIAAMVYHVNTLKSALEQSKRAVLRNCVHVCVFKSLTCINMQELTPLSKQRPRDLHTSDSPAIISNS